MADEKPRSKTGELFRNVIVPAVTVVTALLAAYVNYSVSTVKSALDEQQAELAQQRLALDTLSTERSVQRLDEDLNFRIYDAVTASLMTDDARQQQAATALVIVMAGEPLRGRLLQLFDQAATTAPEVRRSVSEVIQKEGTFQREEAVVQVATAAEPSQSGAGWGEWDVDVFWCERSGAGSEQQAQAIVDALRADGAKGRLRARILPDSINAQAGYGVRGYAIRRDAGEEERATALEVLAERVLPQTDFVVSSSRSGTRWYLSAFVCPGP